MPHDDIPQMRFWIKFGLIIGGVVVTLFIVFVLLLFWFPLSSGGGLFDSSTIKWIIGVGAAFFIIMVILAMIISAITWGFWLGDFRDEDERYMRKFGAEKGKATDPLTIAFQRYAKGEISREEFLLIKEDIERSRQQF